MDDKQAKRFWKKVEKIPFHSCWEWVGSTSRGYGTININSVPVYAHRISYELVNGPIPKGLYILHKCDNPSCINPDHLRTGTHLENIKDMVSKGRQYRKVNSEIVKKIQEEYKTGKFTQKEIGAKYGITACVVSDYVLNKHAGAKQ